MKLEQKRIRANEIYLLWCYTTYIASRERRGRENIQIQLLINRMPYFKIALHAVIF